MQSLRKERAELLAALNRFETEMGEVSLAYISI